MTTGQTTHEARRNRFYDVLRIVFATFVIFAHAPELTDGDRHRELFNRITHSGMTLGEVGVDGFFLLSGYLIVQSWMLEPELMLFLRKRILRIVPGLVVAAAFSVLMIGWLAPAVPHFFLQFHLPFTGKPIKPPVLPGMPSPFTNGSLWTIPYEFRCYLIVALLGIVGFLRRTRLWIAATVILLFLSIHHGAQHLFSWNHFQGIVGTPERFYRLTSAYFVGSAFYIFRNRIPFRPLLAVSAGLLLAALVFVPHAAEPAVVLCGAYLIFYFGQKYLPLPIWARNFPDISYGVYLYGWPVESLWIYFTHTSPWITVLVCTPICFALGWLSWHFVERPMLKLKRRKTAITLPSLAVSNSLQTG